MKNLKRISKRILTFCLTVMTVFSVLIVESTVAHAAENYDGGWALNKSFLTPVYSSASGSTVIGSIDREGITVLSVSGSTYYIEYSTAKGAKRGYIKNPTLDTRILSKTCVAKVINSSTTYYGPNTSKYATAGSVSSGEYVAVLAKEENWVYVEYNTTSGRKRGYMLYSNLSCYNRPQYFPDFYMKAGKLETITTSYQRNIYAGPNDSSYYYVGYIDSSDGERPCYNEYFYGNGEVFHYIEYYTANGKMKSGFLRWDLY